MFNPYFARPIGSRKFEEHLITLMVRNWEMVREEAEMLKDGPVEVRPAAHDAQAYRPLERGWYKLDALIRAEEYYNFLKDYMNGSEEQKFRLKQFAEEMLMSDDEIYLDLIHIGKNSMNGQSTLKRLRRFISQMLYGTTNESTKGCGVC